MTRSILAAALFAALPTVAHAQAAHPLVGKWSMEYPAGMRHEGGTITPVIAKATLSVEAVGDSLIATIETEPVDGRARPSQRLATRVASGDATFNQSSEATVRMGDQESKRMSYTTWVFKVDGDALTGTIERRLEGIEMAAGGPQALKGTRAK